MLYPLGKYLVVEPLDEAKTSSGVLIPGDVNIESNAYKLVKIIEPNIDSKLKGGMRVIVPTHIIEEVAFFGETYYLVTENNIVGFVKTD